MKKPNSQKRARNDVSQSQMPHSVDNSFSDSNYEKHRSEKKRAAGSMDVETRKGTTINNNIVININNGSNLR